MIVESSVQNFKFVKNLKTVSLAVAPIASKDLNNMASKKKNVYIQVISLKIQAKALKLAL
jgi:hypothetical protein